VTTRFCPGKRKVSRSDKGGRRAGAVRRARAADVTACIFWVKNRKPAESDATCGPLMTNALSTLALLI
jgi:hypothetical protein